MAGIAGSVSPVFRDEGYVANATYDFYHAIIHNNKLYFCRQDGTIGHEPQETSDEYWFLSLDGNFADSEMLGGETAEQWQEKITNIINGTTPAGNALKLNGLTAEEFVKGKLSFFQEGETILSWALNPNGEYKKMVVGGYYPEDTPTQTEGFVELLYTDFRIKVKYIEYIDRQRIWSRSIFGGTWYNEWTLDKDGGNADTVDGYHASDLMKFVGTVDASYINAYVAKNPYLAHIIPDTAVAVGLPSQYYRVQFIPDRSNNYGTEIAFPVYGGSPYFRVCDDGVWKPWSTEFLPLTGGRVKRSAYEPLEIENTTADLTAMAFYGVGEKLGSFGFYGKDRPSFFTANGSQKDLLHTGNSLKVQQGTTAPTDTATMWYDTANKTWKRYVDGAWTA